MSDTTVLLAVIGFAGSGWAVVGVGVRMIFRGNLITPREARAMEERAKKAEKNVEDLIAIGYETTAVGKMQKRFVEAAISEPEDG